MRFLLLGLVCLMLFTLLSRQVRQGKFASIDFDVTVKVQDRIGSRFGSALEDVGFLASPGFSIIVIIVITIIKSRKFQFLAIPLAFALLTLAEIYGKSVVHHPAPPFFMLKNPTTIFPTYHVWEEFSYPSGHAARATFLAIVFWFLTIKQFNNVAMSRKLWIGLALGVYVGIISLSRIYLGHHWASDVIGGMLLGLAVGIGVLTAVKTGER